MPHHLCYIRLYLIWNIAWNNIHYNNSMKNIAILTWYKYNNYGTSLQVVALSTYLKNIGYNPYIVNYERNNVSVPYRQTAKSYAKWLKESHKQLNVAYENPDKTALFESFLSQNIQTTEVLNSGVELYKLNEQFDTFIAGSDQIWSPICFDHNYFLSFVNSKINKKISYASSFGTYKLEQKYINVYKKLLSDFDCLSVRESHGKKIVNDCIGIEPTHVLDPSFLLDRDKWTSITETTNNTLQRKSYVLAYFLGTSTKIKDIARDIERHLNKSVLFIPTSNWQKKNLNCVPFEAGPKEFVSLIRNSLSVITDSYHGTIFSCIYNIPFITFKRFKKNDEKNQNSRLDSFFDLIKINKRYVSFMGHKDWNMLLDYDFRNFNKLIEGYIDKSKNYLKSSLEINKSIYSKRIKTPINKYCCGCGACSSICPKDAIKVKFDNNGFYKAILDQNKCIHCGRCSEICPFINISAEQIPTTGNMYSFKSTNENQLKISSSGAAAYEIAKYYLRSGYSVIGCTYNIKHDLAEHIIINDKKNSDINKISGSKYIQSSTIDAFNNISNLKNSKLLFIGTPCQAAAFRMLCNYYSIKDSMILDFVCTGVSSVLLWHIFLKSICKKFKNKEVQKILFRDKSISWRDKTMSIKSNDTNIIIPEENNIFYKYFCDGLCRMDACYECPFRGKSAADIRVGDFWGPIYQNDKDGVSLMIPVTDSGKKITAKLNNHKTGEIKTEKIENYWNYQLVENFQYPIYKDEIIRELKNKKTNLKKLYKSYMIKPSCGFILLRSIYGCYRYIKNVLHK